jgi:hypothetical protein
MKTIRVQSLALSTYPNASRRFPLGQNIAVDLDERQAMLSIDHTMRMAVDNGGERVGQICKRIDGVELARLDVRGDGCLVLRSCIMPGKKRVLAVKGNRPKQVGSGSLL